MGSMIEINDTLQLTRKQGFPHELDLETHLQHPFRADMFSERVFEFSGKPAVRIYKLPPVRNFLVENRGGTWIYWGLVHVLEVTHDNVARTTSGRFRIVYLYTPDEMRAAHDLIDRVDETWFF